MVRTESLKSQFYGTWKNVSFAHTSDLVHQIRSSTNDTASPWDTFLLLWGGINGPLGKMVGIRAAILIHYCFKVYFLLSSKVSPEMKPTWRSILMLSALYRSCKEVHKIGLLWILEYIENYWWSCENMINGSIKPSDCGTCDLNTCRLSILSSKNLKLPCKVVDLVCDSAKAAATYIL